MIYRRLVISFIGLFTLSCVGTKHLKRGESLLYNQKIVVAKPVNKDQLKSQYLQTNNQRILFLPVSIYPSFYYWGLHSYDSAWYEQQKIEVRSKYDKKINIYTQNASKKKKFIRKRETKINKLNRKINDGNLLMRWGEEISVLDSAVLDQTLKNFDVYMSANGWFRSNSQYQVDYFGKRAYVTYLVEEGPRYTFDTVLYKMSDQKMNAFIVNNQKDTNLKKGVAYNQDFLTEERDRIEALLRNNGYFTFSKQYIRYEVDSTWGEHSVAIRMHVISPDNEVNHPVFEVDSVNFTTDVNISNLGGSRINQNYNGVTYQYYEDKYSKKVLNRRLFIRPGQLYSKQNTLDTQRELARMDIFKFVNITYDTTGGKFIANIFASPLDKYQISNEAGLSVTQYFPGPFVSLSLKKRNIIRTLGILSIDGRWGVEGVAAASNPDKILASTEAGGNLGLTFPRFFLPINETTRLRLGMFNPKTSFKAGVTFTQRPEYTRINFSGINSYTWQTRNKVIYDFRLIEAALVRTPFISQEYQDRLDDLQEKGNNLINSFEPSFVSNLSFVRTKNKNNYGTSFGTSSYFSYLIEPGGTFLNVLGKEYFKDQGLETYSYLKFDLDYRQFIHSGKKRGWAFRIRSGVGIPYGENKLLPYEKNFFAGGSISNRAWKPRRLGPGGFNHINESGEVSYQFEQQGEIILESSFEYRQRLFGLIQGAAFVDSGNIWSLREDITRPGAQFKFTEFYRQIAVGVGLGLRLDFSYLLVRFDASLKVVDPARPAGKRFILSPGFKDPPFDDSSKTEPLIYTIAIGLPF